MDALTNGVKDTQQIAASDLAGRTALESLLLEVDQEERRATVYINCRLQGSVSIPWTPREMANDGGEDLRVVSGRGCGGLLPLGLWSSHGGKGKMQRKTIWEAKQFKLVIPKTLQQKRPTEERRMFFVWIHVVSEENIHTVKSTAGHLKLFHPVTTTMIGRVGCCGIQYIYSWP